MAEGLVTQGAATLRVLLKEKIIQRAAKKVGVSVRSSPVPRCPVPRALIPGSVAATRTAQRSEAASFRLLSHGTQLSHCAGQGRPRVGVQAVRARPREEAELRAYPVRGTVFGWHPLNRAGVWSRFSRKWRIFERNSGRSHSGRRRSRRGWWERSGVSSTRTTRLCPRRRRPRQKHSGYGNGLEGVATRHSLIVPAPRYSSMKTRPSKNDMQSV